MSTTHGDLTPREQKVLARLTEFFMRGDRACVACMVEKHWGIALNEPDYPIYEKKHRRLLRILSGVFKSNDKHLLATESCPHHSGYKSYVILDKPIDYELASNLSVNRIEGMIHGHTTRIEQATRRFPKLFKARTKELATTIPYLLPEK